ncbi:MAG: metal-dependent hydrolase [Bacillota bacterium]
MLILGHMGITVGLAGIAGCLVEKVAKKEFNINYGLVALGSMFPDIIDKPLGHMILRDTINYGRIFSHTLVFTALLWLVALWALRRGIFWPLAFSFGTLAHLVLDEMWQRPTVLFWPLYGWGFPSSGQDFLQGVLQSMHRPDVYLPEILGAAILIGFWLGKRGKTVPPIPKSINQGKEIPR